MSKIIAISNEKGGCGKTNASVNIGAALALQGKKILLVDMDHQANLTVAMGIAPNSLGKSIGDLLLRACLNDDFTENTSDYTVCVGDNVDVLPSSKKLAVLEQTLFSAYSREYVLKTALESVRDKYDYLDGRVQGKEQWAVYDYFFNQRTARKVDLKTAEAIRELSKTSGITTGSIHGLLNKKQKPKSRGSFIIKTAKMKKYYDVFKTNEELETLIINFLDEYLAKQQ